MNYERVTFYPDYTYAQFVGTYKPEMDEDGKSIVYSYVPGPFLRILVKALKSGMSGKAEPYLLLLWQGRCPSGAARRSGPFPGWS